MGHNMEEQKITSRWPPWVFFVGIGAALMIATAAAYGSKVLMPPVPVMEPPPPLLLSEVEAPPQAPVAVPAPEPVRIRNPFDKGEVFEFPPGTSEQDARDAVAEALLQRARERGAG
jgi:hypothetical protein